MAITKQDVLEVLGDAKLNWLRFSVGPINVNAFEYEKVADLIASGAIKVVPWEKNYSQYVPLSDTLMTRSGTLDLQGRTNIVHECTHAISDINEVNVTRLTDETAAYLAQMAYLLLLDPDQPEPPYGGPPVYNVMRQGMKLVKKYQLGQPTGQGATISHSDITEYGHMIHAVPDYSFSESQKLDVDGVSLTDDQAKKLIDVQLGRLFDRQMAQEIEQLLTTKVRMVAHENYVTWDAELVALFDSYTRGGDAQKKTALEKLLHIFATIDQASAGRLLSRLSRIDKGDVLSRRFQAEFSPAAQSALLSALRLTR